MKTEKQKADTAQWARDNKARVNATSKAWREANPEKVAASKRRYWEKHGQRVLDKKKVERKEDPSRERERRRAAYWRNPEKFREANKAAYAANPEKFTAWTRADRRANRHRYMIYELRKAAKRQGVEFDLTPEWANEKLAGVCELTGLPFDLENSRSAHSPSVDRIKAGEGYTIANCRMTIWSLNRALGEHGEDYLIGLVQLMLKKREAQ